MHTITSRQPTDKERDIIVGQSRPDIASYGCLTMFLGIVPILLLGWTGGWAGGLVSDETSRLWRWAGWVLGALIFITALVTFIPFERRRRKRAVEDAKAQVVEEIFVSGPKVIEIGLISDNEPVLVFDIGDQKLLFLQGQWLRDEVIYGAPAPQADPHEEFLNGFSEPYSFPSTAFTLARLPHSGRVLGIRVSGCYFPPEKTVEALRSEYEFGDSELLEGRLDEIADVLAREHARRFGTKQRRRT